MTVIFKAQWNYKRKCLNKMRNCICKHWKCTLFLFQYLKYKHALWMANVALPLSLIHANGQCTDKLLLKAWDSRFYLPWMCPKMANTTAIVITIFENCKFQNIIYLYCDWFPCLVTQKLWKPVVHIVYSSDNVILNKSPLTWLLLLSQYGMCSGRHSSTI